MVQANKDTGNRRPVMLSIPQAEENIPGAPVSAASAVVPVSGQSAVNSTFAYAQLHTSNMFRHMLRRHDESVENSDNATNQMLDAQTKTSGTLVCVFLKSTLNVFL